jgi:hypothetical protein
MVGKRVQFDDETWQAIQAVARKTGKSFQKLASTAFAEMLKKHSAYRLPSSARSERNFAKQCRQQSQGAR